jgi:hypothetical protein
VRAHRLAADDDAGVAGRRTVVAQCAVSFWLAMSTSASSAMPDMAIHAWPSWPTIFVSLSGRSTRPSDAPPGSWNRSSDSPFAAATSAT